MTRSEEHDVIRRLGGTLAGLAAQPVQQEKIALWKSLNDLKPQRPMVWITEIPWGEFENDVPELAPVCPTPELRDIETALRRRIFTAQRLSCDEVVEPFFEVRKVIDGMEFGVDKHETLIPQGGSYVQSHAYEPILKEPEDAGRIRMPDTRYNAEATEARRRTAEAALGDTLPVRAAGPRQQFYALWDILICWTGVTQGLMDLAMRPDFIHALMRRLTDAIVARMTQLEERGLLDWPHPLARVGSGAAGYTDALPQPDADPARIRLIDQWGGSTPQIFSDVSPAMHEEFALRYEIEIMERCGLNYYGCCEPLHNKMDILAKVPRLRKISISPWCKTAEAAANAARPYVFSHKPNPAILAEDTFNAARAEAELRRRLDESGGMPCEFIMKDISTVRGDVRRVIDWCALARKVAETHAA
ncbi:MAG: hypothetical protein JW951_09590 [Lentisphaerae bacterium]|nr:hypothetical protein [Lentisphaerota bacterium]